MYVRSLTMMLLGVLVFSFSPARYNNTAQEILGKVDSVVNAPSDQTMNIKLVLLNEDGTTREREIIMYQKGSDRRMGKFLSPADQKGIAFLSLPDGIMYIYLPAFKKTRRIASHVKNTKFAGTDFTYEDMEAGNYVDKFTAEMIGQEDGSLILELTPKPETQSEYSMLRIWVDAERFIPTRIEYYDKGSNLYKVMIREKIEKINGYWFAKELEMSDLKSGQKTRMILQKIELNQNLPDDLFTERYLKR
jgi:outer membrane lipoprotein-sorting protein